MSGTTTAISLVVPRARGEVLREIVVPDKFYRRIRTGVDTLDAIFGGADTPGVLPGCSFLFTGTPGAGKSTLCLQLADLLQKAGQHVFYNIGEESKHMVRLASERIGIDGDFRVVQVAEVDELVGLCAEENVSVVFADSIQTLRDGKLRGAALLKSVVRKLVGLSKSHDVTVFAVGHITKGGGFAGPQEIKHEVDAHAHLRCDPNSHGRTFVLEKNRFGPANVPYVFSLSAGGLDFASIAAEPAATARGSSRGTERRARIVTLIKQRLRDGDSISGYCFERLGVDCSGGFWRHLCCVTRQELEAEGERVTERTVNGRACLSLEPMNNTREIGSTGTQGRPVEPSRNIMEV